MCKETETEGERVGKESLHKKLQKQSGLVTLTQKRLKDRAAGDKEDHCVTLQGFSDEIWQLQIIFP